MRPPLTKRACDECIARKVKCSGAWPCNTCSNAPKSVACTYLKPARRRGPKVRRHPVSEPSRNETTGTESSLDDGSILARPSSQLGEDVAHGHDSAGELRSRSMGGHVTIPSSVLVRVVQLYRDASFNVWPVVNAEVLLRRLDLAQGVLDDRTYCLATALCAATTAQLQLDPLVGNEDTSLDRQVVDSTTLAMECMRVREESNYRENLDESSVLVSFFLHVYHAKINKRNSAMMFVQEAISGARLLRLDELDTIDPDHDDPDLLIANREVLYTLLWVSERGYAMHLGLAPSYSPPIRLPDLTSGSNASNVHVRGLVELARLFAAFDAVAMSRCSSLDQSDLSPALLAQTEDALSLLSLTQGDGTRGSTRMADYCITKEWMRTIIWQEALSRHMLSSTSYVELMTFRFPTTVSRDLLYSLQGFTQSELLPLGRDQLLKCFEVANSLADTVLYTTPNLTTKTFKLQPQDFLHALYQRLTPFLDQDPLLKSILHSKTAEVLVKAPARLLSLIHTENQQSERQTLDENHPGSLVHTMGVIE